MVKSKQWLSTDGLLKLLVAKSGSFKPENEWNLLHYMNSMETTM